MRTDEKGLKRSCLTSKSYKHASLVGIVLATPKSGHLTTTMLRPMKRFVDAYRVHTVPPTCVQSSFDELVAETLPDCCDAHSPQACPGPGPDEEKAPCSPPESPARRHRASDAIPEADTGRPCVDETRKLQASSTTKASEYNFVSREVVLSIDAELVPRERPITRSLPQKPPMASPITDTPITELYRALDHIDWPTSIYAGQCAWHAHNGRGMA